MQKILVGILLIPCIGIAWNPRGDLNVYYAVSQYLLGGKAATIYAENEHLGNFFYGPLGLALLKPLALLPFSFAHGWWVLLNVVSYFVFWGALARLFPALFEKRNRLYFFLVWIASIKPIHASFQSFNIQLMCAALLLAVEVATRSSRKWSFWGGFAIAGLVAIKIFPVFVLLYYFLVKSKELRYGAIAGFATALIAPVLVFGFPLGLVMTRDFVLNLFTYHNAYPLAEGTYLLSLPSLLAWLGKVAGVDAAAAILTKALIVGISAMFFWHTWKRGESLFAWAMALTLMTLLNSVSRVDYFIFYLPAFCALLTYRLEKPSLKRWYMVLVGLSLSLIAFVNEWTLQSAALNHRLEGWRVPVYGMLILCGLLAWVMRERETA